MRVQAVIEQWRNKERFGRLQANSQSMIVGSKKKTSSSIEWQSICMTANACIWLNTLKNVAPPQTVGGVQGGAKRKTTLASQVPAAHCSPKHKQHLVSYHSAARALLWSLIYTSLISQWHCQCFLPKVLSIGKNFTSWPMQMSYWHQV